LVAEELQIFVEEREYPALQVEQVVAEAQTLQLLLLSQAVQAAPLKK